MGKEHDLQCSIIDWANTFANEFPELELLHAIPNGGLRRKATAGKLKAEGVKAGVPDLFLPLPNFSKRLAGLYIELKAPGRENNTSDEQKWWICKLICNGYKVAIGSDFDAVTEGIMNYVEESRKNNSN